MFGSQNQQLFTFGIIDMEKLDLQALGLRALNEKLQKQTDETNQRDWEIINPRGSHAIAVGVDAPINVTVRGSTGYLSLIHISEPTRPY